MQSNAMQAPCQHQQDKVCMSDPPTKYERWERWDPSNGAVVP